MNETEMLRQLARRARLENPPRVDAADAVMRRIRSAPAGQAYSPHAMLRPLMWVAACSALVAVVLVPAALNSWQDWLYPLAGVADSGLGF